MSTQQMSPTELAFDPMDLVSGEYFAANGYPHGQWTYLRKHAPVFHVKGPKVAPFWAITKHADIIEISKCPRLWLNGPRLAVFEEDGTRRPEEVPLKHLLNMDPPEHAEYRSIVSRSFTPRGVSGLEPEIENITRKVLDDVADRTECDFVIDISSKVPVAVIAELLGVPHKDWDMLFQWTNLHNENAADEAIGMPLDTILPKGGPDIVESGVNGAGMDWPYSLDAVIREASKLALTRALHATNGNCRHAAELLGVSRFRVYRMVNRFGLGEGRTYRTYRQPTEV